jgi:hypothetical protein
MTLTSKLGYRYIWIDSICIDQEDSDDKRLQIAIMNDIYQGSVATIVALSASNANSGLARVSHGKSPPQMSCVVSGVVLRTVGPRLARLVRTSTWYHRAWTFQEGRLSPRCVFVSDDGVYFECNSLQCSEALNTELSAIHLSLKDMNHFNQVSYEEALNIGLTRNPVAIKVIDTGRALSIYSGLARRYSHCKITYPNDRLAAFSGMLKALQAMAYRDGFFWGLPHAHLNWAMAWQARWVTDAQNLYFPSWTWLRHMGGIWPCCPFYNSAGPVPETCPFELEFAYYRTETPAQICKIFSQKYTDMSQDLRHLLSGDPLGESPPQEYQGDFSPIHQSALDRLLLFNGLGVEFAVDRKWEEDGDVLHSHVEVTAAGHAARGITTYDSDAHWWEEGKHLFLLLTRHIDHDQNVVHDMILLKSAGQKCYERADVLRLLIPVLKLSILRGLGLHRLSGALI